MFCGWKHCPEEAHLNRWAKRWLIIKYNHQKSLFICLFDLKPGGKRYETTWVAKRTAYAKSFCNSKLLFRGFFLLFLRRFSKIFSSFGAVLRSLPHSCATNNRPSFCMLPYNPGYRLLTNARHTCCGSMHVVTVLGKGKNACTFPECDIGHLVSQKEQFDCYFTTDRVERPVMHDRRCRSSIL